MNGKEIPQITLALDGDQIPLEDFAETLKTFTGLLKALTQHLGQRVDAVQWNIAELASGSAVASVAPEIQTPLAIEVAQAFLATARSLAEEKPIEFPEPVPEYAFALTRVIDGKVKALRLGALEREVAVKKRLQYKPSPSPMVVGTVSGKLDAAWAETPRIRLGLRDKMTGRRVIASYPPAEGEEYQRYMQEARDLWGKEVVVTGYIERDPITGTPQKVAILQILPAKETVQALDAARGALSYLGPAENIVRRLRESDGTVI